MFPLAANVSLRAGSHHITPPRFDCDRHCPFASAGQRVVPAHVTREHPKNAKRTVLSQSLFRKVKEGEPYSFSSWTLPVAGIIIVSTL
jgi:hypothetical protein